MAQDELGTCCFEWGEGAAGGAAGAGGRTLLESLAHEDRPVLLSLSRAGSLFVSPP